MRAIEKGHFHFRIGFTYIFVAITRRVFLTGAAAATSAAALSLMPMQEGEKPPIDEKKALKTFDEGKVYWDIITDGGRNRIPKNDRIALGRLMHETKEGLPIQFAQDHGGVSYDAITKLKSPRRIASESFIPVNNIRTELLERGNIEDIELFQIVSGLAELEFRKTLIGGRDGMMSGPPDYMVILGLEAAQKAFAKGRDGHEGGQGLSDAFEKAEKSLEGERQGYIDGKKSAEDKISCEQQKEYVDLMTAKLAYCMNYYFPESKKTLLGGRLRRINLHYGFLRDPELERRRFHGKDPFSNRFADWDYLNMRGGGYEPNRGYLSLPIDKIRGNLKNPIADEHGSLMHELGHVIPLGYGRNMSRRLRGVAGELLSLSIEEYRIVFSTDYGHPQFKQGGEEYCPYEETTANMYNFCSKGSDFPKKVGNGMREAGLDESRVKGVCSALKSFKSILEENGYRGNPEWIAR